MKHLIRGAVMAAFIGIPAFALANGSYNGNPAPHPAGSVTITSVTLDQGTYGNGGPYLVVNPGDPITVAVTADLDYKVKWKGTAWGVNNVGDTPTCVNTKNKHARLVKTGFGSAWYGGDDRDDHFHSLFGFFDHKFNGDHETNSTYTITFTIYAPQDGGLYDANFLPDGKNNCGSPVGPLYTLTRAILVGADTHAPVIAPHDDVLVTLDDLNGTGAVVSYDLPTATDDIDLNVPVSCEPASGTFFPLGSTIVTCMAYDSSGNMAMPTTFSVTVELPPDLTPPVIAPHADVSVEAAASDSTDAVVTYTNPTATDDRDGSVAVSCDPASGSTFALGTTTVTCSAEDAATNLATSTFDVGVYLPSTPPPPADIEPPVIAPHDDIVVVLTHTGDTSTAINYTPPTATDDVDASVAVTCDPASGSTFPVGTTTVACSATDAAGNAAIPTMFDVGVYPFVSQPVVLASQPDESYLCATGWEDCFTGGSNHLDINLGKGDSGHLQDGALHDITLSLDSTFAASIPGDPFRITISCFTDAGYSTPCPDWVEGNTHNGLNNSIIFEDTLTTTDSQHWSAEFTNPSNEANFDGSSPVLFDPSYYYQMRIAENFVGWPMYGSGPSGDPYWAINGLTQD